MKNMLLAATITGIALAGVILYLSKNNSALNRLINGDSTPATY